MGQSSWSKATGIGPVTPETNKIKAMENAAMEIAMSFGPGSIRKVDPQGIAGIVKQFLTDAATAKGALPLREGAAGRAQQALRLNDTIRELGLPDIRGTRMGADGIGTRGELLPRTPGQYAKLATGIDKAERNYLDGNSGGSLSDLGPALGRSYGDAPRWLLDEILEALMGGKGKK